MKRLLLPIIFILLLTFTLIGNCAWLDGWDYRMELAIGDYAGDIGAEVVWFPVTIHLKDANGDSTKIFEEIGNNYRKMAITKADGTTELKGEIEGWNYDAGTPANSTGFIHTSADGWTINSNTSIWVYYDNDHADNANIDVINTTPGTAVWDGNFKAVWHMVDNTTSTVKDSTSSSNDGTKASANNPIEAAGKVGQGQNFSSDHIDCGDDVSLDITTAITIEMLINTDTTPVNVQPINRDDGINRNYTFLLPSTLEVIFYIWSGGDAKSVATDSTIATGQWYHLAGTYDGAELKIYKDGSLDCTPTEFIGAIDNDDVSFTIGAREDGMDRNLDGLADEVRISSVGRSAAWLKGTKNTLWDALFTYGSEEESPIGVGTLWFGTDF